MLEPGGLLQPWGTDAPLSRRPCAWWWWQSSTLGAYRVGDCQVIYAYYPSNKWLVVYYPSYSFIVIASCLCPPRSTLLNCNNRMLLFYLSPACRCLFVWNMSADQAAPDFTCVNFTSVLIWCSVPVGSVPVWFRCCCRFSVVCYTMFSHNCRVLVAWHLCWRARRERERGRGKTTSPYRRLDT